MYDGSVEVGDPWLSVSGLVPQPVSENRIIVAIIAPAASRMRSAIQRLFGMSVNVASSPI